MNSPAIRNGLILVAAVVIAIVVLGFFSTLLSAIVPIGITAIIAFILGRLSVNVNLLDIIRSARAAKPAEATKTPPKSVELDKVREDLKPSTTEATKKPAQAAQRLVDEPQQNDILLDPNFEVKTSEQIEAESRVREQEAMQKAASDGADAVQAALEERRKRLLGGKD